MSPRLDVSEERKEQILAAATRVFARQGFDAARMADIAEEADLSIGGVYWYYKGKDDLIEALIASLFAPDIAAMHDLLDAPGSARDRLLGFMDRHLHQLEPATDLFVVIYRAFGLGIGDVCLREHLAGYVNGYLDGIAALLEQGMAHGEFRQTDARQAARGLVGLIDGIALQWLVDPDEVAWADMVLASITLLLDALSADLPR